VKPVIDSDWEFLRMTEALRTRKAYADNEL
jgi:hypothetical protein